LLVRLKNQSRDRQRHRGPKDTRKRERKARSFKEATKGKGSFTEPTKAKARWFKEPHDKGLLSALRNPKMTRPKQQCFVLGDL